MNNIQITNNLQSPIYNNQRFRERNLEVRTLEFTRGILRLCKKLPKNTLTIELIRQIIRSAGSVGANYREANEKLSKRDFAHRMRIARKEAKETTYWLEVLQEATPEFTAELAPLTQESLELRNIFSAILVKSV